MAHFDYVIVGSGLTGGVIARELKDAGKNVIVLEKRKHLGGNVHDQLHSSGILYHTYGPHYFRTNSDDLWNYVNRFTRFYRFEACLKSFVENEYVNWPISGEYIEKHCGKDWKPSFSGEPSNFEEASLSLMPELIYERFVKGYTRKQWGVDPKLLDKSLAKRFDVRLDNDPRLMKHTYQGLPENGYSQFIKNLFTDIKVELEFDYLKQRDKYKANTATIFTGPIDNYYDYCFGKLMYRGQQRQMTYLPDTALLQPTVQLNNPSEMTGDHIRTIEWKHIMNDTLIIKTPGTLITREITFTPEDPGCYEYPFPNEINNTLYNKYASIDKDSKKLLLCGRLGEYRYYDMDQAIARARYLAKMLM